MRGKRALGLALVLILLIVPVLTVYAAPTDQSIEEMQRACYEKTVDKSYYRGR